MTTYGYLYKYPFDFFNITDTPLDWGNGDSFLNAQFQIVTYLQVNITYVLIITTSYTSNQKNVQGSFIVIAEGANGISMERIGTNVHNYITRINKFIFF